MLPWRLSNTLDVSFCVDALEDAIAWHGIPDIFSTDQGSQFTSEAFTGVLNKNGIKVSMDGKGRWRDNGFVERLWKSVKYEGGIPEGLRLDYRGQESAWQVLRVLQPEASASVA